MTQKHTLLITALFIVSLTRAATSQIAPNRTDAVLYGSNIHFLHFDSASTAVSMSDDDEYIKRDSIRRAEYRAHDRGAGLGGRFDWTEHRDPRPDGKIALYWTNEDPVYSNGNMSDYFWGLAVPDSAWAKTGRFRIVRWFHDPNAADPGDETSTAWYLSVK